MILKCGKAAFSKLIHDSKLLTNMLIYLSAFNSVILLCGCVRTIQSTTLMARTVGTPPNGRPCRTLLRECER